MNLQESFDTKLGSFPRRIAGGVMLVALGVLLLVGQILNLDGYGHFMLAVLSGLFLISGLLTRTVGLLIPGGILGGISLGLWAQAWPLISSLPSSSVFLLGFAAGWVVIVLLALAIGRPTWWPLIPGSIMAAIGSAQLAGGLALSLVQWVGAFGWPLALIAIGLFLLARRR